MQKITTLRDQHMPLIKKKFNKYRHRGNAWITTGILKSLKTKDKLHAKLKKTKNEAELTEIKNRYNSYKRIYDKVVKTAKQL